MSEKRNLDFLLEIREAIIRIQDYIDGLDYASFMDDMKTRDAVIRNLEIIGEASKNISFDFKTKYKKIPWKEMSGIRDKLIHHYFGINFEIVWTIIYEELPFVFNEIKKILDKT